uniref:TatD DNase domain containing 3 n=1 Tax=Hucho hucho TaxID=62062 RepID=A0A4W5PJ65_9TELE
SMKGFIDCHCHISAGDFDKVGLLRNAGLLALLAVAEHVGEFEKIIQLSQRFPGFIFPCLGVHPIQGTAPEPQRGALLQDLDSALPLIEKYKDHLVAIGEVGLDFTPRFVSGDADKDSQRQVLIRQAEIAKQLDLPLNVHSRSAGRPTIHLLKEQGNCIYFYVHYMTRSMWTPACQGSVPASQVLPHRSQQTISVWTSLCAQGELETDDRLLPEAVWNSVVSVATEDR